ncbi:MAG: NCS2 family permease [Bacteroidales bacterium]|nr:NCS2 family permease [Bacteroidales bacterium]
MAGFSFQLSKNNTNLKTEIIAGITTFISGMYIIIVNPAILVHAGIPYSAGLTSTVILSAFATIGMGLYARNPILVAPGMGINAYITYAIVQGMHVPPEVALGTLFWTGLVFVLLSVFNVRTWIVESIPETIRQAGAIGIGLFIALIGMVNAGFIVPKPPFSGVGPINSLTLTFLLGLLITIILVVKKVRGALIIGIVFTTLLAWPIGRWYGDATAVSGIKELLHWNGIYKAPDFSWFFKLDLMGSLKYAYIPIIFALLFVDMFDSLTTFVGVAEAGNLKDKNGDPRNIKQSLIVDGFATLFAGVLGTTSGTAYIESATGIQQGGRTGLTAVVTGLLFLPFMFFSPLAELVPSIATAPILVIVGVFMAASLGKINWTHLEEAIPAFLTIVLIPLTYSLTQGIVYGLLTYSLIKLVLGKHREISPTLWVIDILSLPLLAIEYGLI